MRSSKAELVILKGDEGGILDTLDTDDYNLLMSGTTDAELVYLSEKYPELMGFWAAIARGVAKVGGAVFRGVSRKRKRKRKARKAARARKKREEAVRRELQRQEQIRAYQMQVYQKQQADKTRNMMVMGGGGLLALLLLMRARKG